MNGVTTAKRVAEPVCRDREELKNASLGWLLREVHAAEEGVEVGGRADSCSTIFTESSHEYAEALTVP